MTTSGSTSMVNTVPTVLSVGTPQGVQRGLVPLPYTVADDQSDLVDVEVHYMLDAISGWKPATPAQTSAPTQGLATSPTGKSYSFLWDAYSDLGPVTKPAVIVRGRARDAAGVSVARVTGSFAVDNR